MAHMFSDETPREPTTLRMVYIPSRTILQVVIILPMDLSHFIPILQVDTIQLLVTRLDITSVHEITISR